MLPQIWLLGETQRIEKHHFQRSGALLWQRENQELTMSEVSCESGVEQAVRGKRSADQKG